MNTVAATAPPEPAVSAAPPPRRSRLRVAADSSAMLLTLGTLASGVLAYAFNVVAARTLGPADYGPIAVLWAGMFLVSVVLFRPVEQMLTRSIADRVARGADARPVVRSTAWLTLAVVLAVALAVALAWRPLTNGLFNGQGILTLAFALGIAGYGVSYFVRGAAAGLLWLDGYGLLLLADGAVRLLLLAPLLFVASPAVAAAAVAAAAIGGGLAPFAHRTWRDRSRRDAELLGALRGSRKDGGAPAAEPQPFAIGEALRFAAPATVMAAADQVLVSGGALLVILAGGPGAAAAAGIVFAATMLVRAPVFLFQGIAASLLPNLTRMDALRDEHGFRRHLSLVCGALLAFGVVLTAGALAAGPQLMRLLFGDGFAVEREDLGLLCAGVGVYLLGATLSQAALARGLNVRAAAVWTVSAATFVTVQLLVTGAPLHRVSVAFAAAAAVLATLFVLLVTRCSARPPCPSGMGRETHG